MLSAQACAAPTARWRSRYPPISTSSIATRLHHLAERDRPAVKHRLRRAWAEENHDRALAALQTLAGELEHFHPGAAASLKEGMAETLTVTRLHVRGALKPTLQSTNPCESMIETVRHTSRTVKRWQSGEMCLRWTSAGMLEAERQFRRIIGQADLARLALVVEKAAPTPADHGGRDFSHMR